MGSSVWCVAAKRQKANMVCFFWGIGVCWIQCDCLTLTEWHTSSLPHMWSMVWFDSGLNRSESLFIWTVYVEVYWFCFTWLFHSLYLHFIWINRNWDRWGMKHEHLYTLDETQHAQVLQVIQVNRPSLFVSPACSDGVVTVVSLRRFICCVSHDIFIRVGLQRVGGDQVLSGL